MQVVICTAVHAAMGNEGIKVELNERGRVVRWTLNDGEDAWTRLNLAKVQRMVRENTSKKEA